MAKGARSPCACTLPLSSRSAPQHSRTLGITGGINGMTGHFVGEVFDQCREQWIVHDANYDVHYCDNGRPLSGVDLADRALTGVRLTKLAVAGRGMPTRPARVVRAFRRLFATGISYKNLSVWRHNNLVSDPRNAPPNHGSHCYCETGFVWYNPVPHDIAPMFPYRTANRRWFERPPR